MIGMVDNKFSVIILAAGKGKRMKNNDIPKVLAELAGKPLIGHVLDQAELLNPEKTAVVVGHHKDKVIEYIESLKLKKILYAEQLEQLGTGHAVQQTEKYFNGYDGDILILCGDVPLLQAQSINEFINEHIDNAADCSVLSTIMPNPTGYGRIVRSNTGDFICITEEKDASEKVKLINEINSGVYIVKSKSLFDSINQLKNNNAQGEYYLTDIIQILSNLGKKVQAVVGPKFIELQGINSPEDLEIAEKYYNKLYKNN
jgi:UDP-N-acetylglucosamine diphosphorylase/glucosamine-1-phosphate N-acetyltransferase